MENNTVASYINTLIFCIVAKAVTLGLLVMLLFDMGWKYKWLILTIEICMILIVAITLYKVYAFQKAIDEAAKAAATSPPFVSTCPDYFVKRVDEDQNEICDNTYKGVKFTNDNNAIIGSQNMTDMVRGKKSMNEFCTASASQMNAFAWTDVKARCGFLDTYV